MFLLSALSWMLRKLSRTLLIEENHYFSHTTKTMLN